MTVPKSKERIFSQLVSDVSMCTLCERMKDSARVLGGGVGNLSAELMFLGEAPGRLGADRTMLPFHGDVSGDNFEDFLDFVGLSREHIYVSNVVLCNPKDTKGNNSTPVNLEVSNCSSFLLRQLELVKPKLIVTLGATALKALENIEPHGLSLKKDVRTCSEWNGSYLVPLYHPGRRAMVHRSLANQRSDYQFVADTLKRLTGRRVARSVTATRDEIFRACIYIIEKKKVVSYFELHKLMYMAEYTHARKNGERLTKAFYIRQKDGPYCVDIAVKKLMKVNNTIRAFEKDGKLYLSMNRENDDLFSRSEIDKDVCIKDIRHRDIFDDVIHRYSYSSEFELKQAVYMTAPMRRILRKEKGEKINLYNSPIDFMV